MATSQVEQSLLKEFEAISVTNDYEEALQDLRKWEVREFLKRYVQRGILTQKQFEHKC